MKKRKQRKRLMIEDRMIIQACVHDRRNISQIASRLGVNKSTISRELKINSYTKPGNKISCDKKSKGDKTPYDLLRKKFGKEFLDKIGIKRIANKKVRLRPII